MASLKITVAFFAVVLTGNFACTRTLQMFVFEKGETGHIPCIIRGESQAYFWKIGKTFEDSKALATFIHDKSNKFANETFGKHTVLEDGTLVIYRMTYTDEGNYHCRVATESSEYYSSVAVFLKAFRNGSTFGIDECESNSNCRLHTIVDSLTCEATFVSSQLRLRWLNNSIELQSYEKTVQNDDDSFNVSNTFPVNDDSPSILICEAYGEAMESKHILIELMDETERPVTESHTSPWMPVSIVLIIAFIAVVICMVVVLLIKYKDQSKKGEPITPIEGEGTQLLHETHRQENEQLRESLDTHRQENEQLRESLDTQKQENEELQESLDTHKQENEQLQKSLDTHKREIEQLQKSLDTHKREIEQLTESLDTSENEIKNRQKNLKTAITEFAERSKRAKSLANKDEPQIFLRIRDEKRQENTESIDRRSVLNGMKENYKLTRIFKPEEEQDKVFSHLEDIVQSAVDGNMICIVAFGTPKSGKTFTMSNYNSSAKDSQGIIPRAISKIFECEKDLQEKGFEVKISATHLGTYLKNGEESFRFYEMSSSESKEQTEITVKGLKVGVVSYHITSEEQALDLLKGSPVENEGMSAGTKRADLFHITVDISMNQEKVSQGILSLATFHGADATKQLINNEKNSPLMSLLTTLITNKSCRMAMIVTIKMDTSPETQETLHFIDKMREVSEKRWV